MIKTICSLIFLGLIIAQTAIAGGSCTSIDLRGPKLGDVRNQNQAGWCFAYTAADLVSFKVGKKISAFDMAINFYQKMPEMPRNEQLTRVAGGSDMGAITYMGGKFCAEESLTSETVNIPKECAGNKAVSAFDALKAIEEYSQSSSMDKCQLAFIKEFFRNLNSDDIQKIMNNNQFSSFEKIIALKEKNCSDKKIIPNQKIVMKEGLSSDGILDINKQLEAGNILSLNYNANFLLKKFDVNITYNHYSSIVGRRLDPVKKSCQYLIRNSWGSSCIDYPAPYNTQCEAGNIWVNEDVLRKTILSIKYLK